ncbi:hypothetical protein [Streptomyces sp. NPDC054838]
MRLKEIKPLRVYAVKAADNNIVPALVLDNVLWNRRLDEGTGTHYYEPAEHETWSTATSFGISSQGKQRAWTRGIETGERTGILVALPVLGTLVDTNLVTQLDALSKTLGSVGAGIERTTGAAAAVSEALHSPLRMDVIRTDNVRMPWERHVSGASMRRCPHCGQPVQMSAASRLRGHNRKNGTHCPRSNTTLTARERDYS